MTPPNFGSQKMFRGPAAAGRRFGTKINGKEVDANGDGIQENFAVVCCKGGLKNTSVRLHQNPGDSKSAAVLRVCQVKKMCFFFFFLVYGLKALCLLLFLGF